MCLQQGGDEKAQEDYTAFVECASVLSLPLDCYSLQFKHDSNNIPIAKLL